MERSKATAGFPEQTQRYSLLYMIGNIHNICFMCSGNWLFKLMVVCNDSFVHNFTGHFHFHPQQSLANPVRWCLLQCDHKWCHYVQIPVNHFVRTLLLSFSYHYSLITQIKPMLKLNGNITLRLCDSEIRHCSNRFIQEFHYWRLSCSGITSSFWWLMLAHFR